MAGTQVWDDRLLANPHAAADKRQRVQKMFAAIAPSYDLNNRLHSLWMDQRWRRTAVKLAKLKSTDVVVDVACGTGDLTALFAKRLDALDNSNTRSFLQRHPHGTLVVSGIHDLRSPNDRRTTPLDQVPVKTDGTIVLYSGYGT